MLVYLSKKVKIYGLMGPNGSGKTTLMKIIIGLHKQTSGNVLINGVPPFHIKLRQMFHICLLKIFYMIVSRSKT